MKNKILALVGALVIILLVPMTVIAATDTSTISGTVGATITIDSPATITLPSLTLGQGIESTAQLVMITSNANWSLTVAESGGESDGKMAKTDAHPMTNTIEVKGGEASYTSLALPVTLKASGSGNLAVDNVFFKQTVAASEIAGTYSMTVIFTVTPGA